MVTCFTKNYFIKIFEEDNFYLNSTDNKQTYNNQILLEEGSNKSALGIRTFQNGKEINSLVLLGDGRNGLVFDSSLLIHENQILLCCCNYICSISINTLNVNWKKEIDIASAWHIYPLEDDFLVHGEIEISRITKQGIVKWQFSGADIFYSMEGNEACKIENGLIHLTDFNESKYVLNFNGEDISER